VLAVAHLEDCAACRHRVLRMRGLAALTPPVPAALALLAGSGTGSSGAGGGRSRTGRRARNAGLTAAAAAALATTAPAGARLADDPPTDRASGAPAAAGGAPAAARGHRGPVLRDRPRVKRPDARRHGC
jgi:hypothetical protein